MEEHKQISISKLLYARLVDLKIHPRESFNDVIERILNFYQKIN
jgi:predicted CopG family antitoxin